MTFDDYINLLYEVAIELDSALIYRVDSIFKAKEKWIDIAGRDDYDGIHFCAASIHNPFSGIYYPHKAEKEIAPTIVRPKDSGIRFKQAMGRKYSKTGNLEFDKRYSIAGDHKMLIDWITNSASLTDLLLSNPFLSFGIKNANGLFTNKYDDFIAVLFMETNFWLKDKKLIIKLFDEMKEAVRALLGKDGKDTAQYYLMNMK